MSELPHVVIIGGGFGGLCTARALARAPFRVTLIDRRNHHLFQPLLYQVATGGLSPANIAAPLRALVKKQPQTRVLLAEVTGIDAESKTLILGDETLSYDYLVVATGAGQSYFGNDHWKSFAPGLKTLDDATRIRRGVLMAYELAEQETDPEVIRRLLTFVVVGAGPTGVELAGALAELSRTTLKGELRQVDPTQARVILIEGADRVLPPFPAKLSAKAQSGLKKLGVEVRCKTLVSSIDDQTLELKSTVDETVETLEAANILWAAGVQASPLGKILAEQSQADTDRAGRVEVRGDCSLAGRPEIFVIGDLAHFNHGLDQPLPGLAPVAMQQGRYVAKRLKNLASQHPVSTEAAPTFRYVDKGNMAVIGRRMAVVDIHGFGIAGGIAWFLWLFVHLMYLAEFQNRVLVLVQWGWNYFTRNRSARLISEKIVPNPKVRERSEPSDSEDEGSKNQAA